MGFSSWSVTNPRLKPIRNSTKFGFQTITSVTNPRLKPIRNSEPIPANGENSVTNPRLKPIRNGARYAFQR